jgi:hypothetical protein
MKQIQEDKIISEFLKSLGPWRNFVVIGGGFALFIYKLYLADLKLENLPVGTRDIDSLIPRRVPEISKKNIAKYLNEAGFTHVFKHDRGHCCSAIELLDAEPANDNGISNLFRRSGKSRLTWSMDLP